MLEETDGEQERERPREKKPVVLPWLGWSSDTMLLADMRNLMDAVTTAKYGGKHAKPSPVYPPGHREDTRPQGRMSIRDFAAKATAMARMGN